MELISKQIKKETDTIPYSTLVSRYQKWFDDYYIRRIEEPIETQNNIIMIPGKIYTFAYDPSEDYKNECDFFSHMPINLILGHKITKAGNWLTYGINLSFIPPSVRIRILDEIIRIWNTDIIKPNIERLEKGLPILHDIPIFYDVAKKILEGSGFEWAIRSYRMERIASLPLIVTYSDWYKLSFFTIKFIMKMQVRAIYVKYNKNIHGKQWKIGMSYGVDIKGKKIKEVKEYFSKRQKY